MFASVLTIGLAGLASASPLISRQSAEQSTSKGFRLRVHVTQPSDTFKPDSLENSYISSIHVGAGLSLASPGGTADTSRVFYQNGTAEEQQSGQTSLSTDEGTPPAPGGWQLDQPADGASSGPSTVHINGGFGTPGVHLSDSSSDGPVFLEPETYLVCNTSVPYYHGQYFSTIEQTDSTDVPDNCVGVRLLPECAELEHLPDDAFASHEYALDSTCYKDVSSINWGQ